MWWILGFSVSCLSIIDLTSNKQQKFLPSLLLMSTLTPILMRPRISSSVIVIFILAGFDDTHARLLLWPLKKSLTLRFHGFFLQHSRKKGCWETLLSPLYSKFVVYSVSSRPVVTRWWSSRRRRRRPDLLCFCCCRLLDEGNYQSWPFLRSPPRPKTATSPRLQTVELTK